MAKILLWAVGFVLLLEVYSASGKDYKLVCYYTNWAHKRGDCKFLPEDINPRLCTHLIFAFAVIGNNHQIVAQESEDEDLYISFNNLKKRNPNLKTLLSVGGWNFGTEKFTAMASSKDTRLIFIKSVIEFLRQKDFDGLDLHWEYPAFNRSPYLDKQRFTLLVQILHSHPNSLDTWTFRFYPKETFEEFKKESGENNKPRLLLSAAVASGIRNIQAGYEIEKISEPLDFIGVMTYEFHGPWDVTTGPNSPLYRSSTDYYDIKYFNVEFATNYWKENGAPAEKLLVGFPTYGRTFTLCSADNKPGAAACGPASPGNCTKAAGIWAYYEGISRYQFSVALLPSYGNNGTLSVIESNPSSANQLPSSVNITITINGSILVKRINDTKFICDFLKGAKEEWMEEQEVPYAYKDDEWVTYDNLKSFEKKVEWLKNNSFGGAMVWTIDMDDSKGTFCKQGKSPLISKLKIMLSSKSKPKDDSSATTTVSPTPTLENSSNSQPSTTCPNLEFCSDKNNGSYPISCAADSFYRCTNKNTDIENCPKGTSYNAIKGKCVWPERLFPAINLVANNFCKGKRDGNYAIPTPKYFRCSADKTRIKQCPPDLLYNTMNRNCDRSMVADFDVTFCSNNLDGTYPIPGKPNKFYHCSNKETIIGNCPKGSVYNNLCKC